jgi:hypothetical protein
MKDLEFYTDDSGNPCARGNDERLAVFLQSDLQGSIQVTRDLIEKVANGQVRSEFHGNGHSVIISPQLATIESNFDDEAPDRRLPREDLLAHLREWLAFIER